MDNPNNHHLPEPNPYTRDRHRRQVFWQILFPIILFAILIVALAVLISVSATSQVARLSNISIVFLIIPTAIIGLLVFGVFGAVIFLQARVISALPPYARLAQIYLDRLTAFLKKLADSAANPVVNIESALAGLRSVFQRPGNNHTEEAARSRTTR